MTLSEYKRKRDFSKTKEPKPEIREKKGKRLIYVIQRHNASHLHYDLRLEKDGVLKSWAIPKEPPESIGIKRLAVMTEDHPVDYAAFRGKIPQGEYGAGEVRIWDKGSHMILEYKPDKIITEINGEKLTGKYCLLKFKTKDAKSNNNWLFFKMI